jgi:hypothetical protein
MKLKIEITMDNAAFEDGGTDEAKRAVWAALEQLRGQWAAAPVEASVLDINGNEVGTAKVTS